MSDFSYVITEPNAEHHSQNHHPQGTLTSVHTVNQSPIGSRRISIPITIKMLHALGLVVEALH
jgi:hypothetical protein